MPYQLIEEWPSPSEKKTFEWGKSLALKLVAGDIVGLQGNLGSGKTILCKGIADGLKFTGPVTSPSYTLVNEYMGRCKIFHLDLYRLEGEVDWNEIGMDYYFSDEGICLVEWPERLDEMESTCNYLIKIQDEGHKTRKICLYKKV